MSDPLAKLFMHPIVVERRTDSGGLGQGFSTPEIVVGFWDVALKLVPSDGSEKAEGGGTATLPEGTAFVPVGSKLSCPSRTGAAKVIVTEASAPSGPFGPNHLELVVSG